MTECVKVFRFCKSNKRLSLRLCRGAGGGGGREESLMWGFSETNLVKRESRKSL